MPRENIVLKPREIDLLQDLFASRIMTLLQFAKLHFEERIESAKKHVQKLKQAGYIGERERKVNERSVLFLSKSGFQLLRGQGYLARYPHVSEVAFEKRIDVAQSTVAHELAVMDVKAALVSALMPQFETVEFSTWPRLHQFRVVHPRTRAPRTIKPDGFLRVGEADRFHHFFLEIDRSTESLTVLLDKVLGYYAHYQSGGFAVGNGATREQFREYPFRVLVVIKTEERRNNLAEALLSLSPSILTHAWLATLSEITGDPLGAIWVRPLDYRTAVGDSPYAHFTTRRYGDSRSITRDKFVAASISRNHLFDIPSLERS